MNGVQVRTWILYELIKSQLVRIRGWSKRYNTIYYKHQSMLDRYLGNIDRKTENKEFVSISSYLWVSSVYIIY